MEDKKKEFLSQVKSKALLPILTLPSKPTKPEEPSSFQEFYYSFSELANKFIEENDFAKVELGRFLHAEEFFLWLSKLAASDDLVMRCDMHQNTIEDYGFYMRMDSSQFDHQKQEYEKALVKYEKDLSEYDEKCLTIIDENINNLKTQVDKMIKAREELLKNSEKLKT